MSQAQEKREDSLEINLSDEESDVPSPKRPREAKKHGDTYCTYAYKSKSQAAWQKKWPCIAPVKDNPRMFQCTICFKASSCAHQGERDVTHHIESVQPGAYEPPKAAKEHETYTVRGHPMK